LRSKLHEKPQIRIEDISYYSYEGSPNE